MKKNLTEKQQRVYDFIVNYIKTIGYPPAVRDISSWFDVTPKTAHKYIAVLRDKGYIQVTPNISRGIKVL